MSKKAVVIGAGFIGLEAAENLKAKGVQVTVIDFASQILPNIIDPEMAVYAKKHLLREGIRVITGTKAEAVLGNEAVTGVKTSAGVLGCELLIMAAGIRPNTDFLEETGLKMFKGTILVDNTMKTNLEDVYAAGDCAMVTNRLTGKPQWSPMGSSANDGRKNIGSGFGWQRKIISGRSGNRRGETSGIEHWTYRTYRRAGKGCWLRRDHRSSAYG